MLQIPEMQNLQEQDLRRRAIFNAALDAIIVTDHEGQKDNDQPYLIGCAKILN